MRWMTLGLAICLVGGAHAGSILDFDPAVLGPNEIRMPNSYGDRLPGTPNIDMSYVNVDYTPQTFGVLTAVAAGTYPGSALIIFTPDPGYGVELLSLDMAFYQSVVVQTLRLLDGNGNLLENLDPRVPFYFGGSAHYTPNSFQPGVLQLEFAPNEYLGLDNIQFDQFPIDSGAPEPGTFSVLGAGLAVLLWRSRR
jgi:PEP-CTERM motif